MKNWIVIYTTSKFECPYCVKMKELLNVYGYDFYEKDIHENETYKREFLERGHKTVPQVYIEGTLIGGYDKASKYFRSEFYEDHPDKNNITDFYKDQENGYH